MDPDHDRSSRVRWKVVSETAHRGCTAIIISPFAQYDEHQPIRGGQGASRPAHLSSIRCLAMIARGSQVKMHAHVEDIVSRHRMLLVISVRRLEPGVMTAVRGSFANSGMGLTVVKNSIATRVIRGEPCRWRNSGAMSGSTLPAHAVPEDNALLRTQEEEEEEREERRQLAAGAINALPPADAHTAFRARSRLTQLLVGQSALVYTNEDPVVAAKAALKIVDEHANVISLMGGTFEDSLLDTRLIKELVNLPTRQDAAAELLTAMKAPLRLAGKVLKVPVRQAASRLRNAAAAPQRKLIRSMRASSGKLARGLGARERQLAQGPKEAP